MNSKISELKTLCDFYHLELVIRFYGNSTNFIGMNKDDNEVFNACVWRKSDKVRIFFIEANSQYEQWRGGQFSKKDILLLLSIDDLSDEELNIKPRTNEVKSDVS